MLKAVSATASAASRICKSKMNGVCRPVPPKFISLENGKSTKTNTPEGFSFRLVSYNILAQVYVKSSCFPHSPSSCLKWKARSQEILKALKNFDADLLCIQELDEYDSFYKSNMEKYGYSSIYVKRTGQKRDGCGIFYKHTSAALILKEEIHFNDLVNFIDCESEGAGTKTDTMVAESTKEVAIEDSTENSQSDHGDPNDPRVRLNRDCVALLAAFKLSDPSHHLVVVANTHIYWDPEWIDVKLAQAKYLLSRLAQFKRVVYDRYSYVPTVIVAGDFNSTPGDEVYQYLVSANTTNGPQDPPIQLHSLYATNGGEPPFTNYTPGFTGTLDYIFLTESTYLRPVSLLQLPGPESAEITGGLPNQLYPSDHLPIGADFEVTEIADTGVIPELQDVSSSLNNLKIDGEQCTN